MDIEDVREYTLSLFGVTEDQPFGDDIRYHYEVSVLTATPEHHHYIPDILSAIHDATLEKGTSIVMSLRLGFTKVPYSALTTDPAFWKGCATCPHYHTLLANNGQTCECQGLLFDPDRISY